ncbi:hypothetical protein HZH68_012871 [Vespula germanica]|uniref:Uncharacterized protein n=1 Tax=Vespula germanica TaxID=30212 RepID=A0A834JHI3_VESGE|nr:hypothetical protein HZH68_012871 [Vespula germanica]
MSFHRDDEDDEDDDDDNDDDDDDDDDEDYDAISIAGSISWILFVEEGQDPRGSTPQVRAWSCNEGHLSSRPSASIVHSQRTVGLKYVPTPVPSDKAFRISMQWIGLGDSGRRWYDLGVETKSYPLGRKLASDSKRHTPVRLT